MTCRIEQMLQPFLFLRTMTLAACSLARYLYLSRLSKPPRERYLYRCIKKQGFHRIVELGIGDGIRGSRLVETALRFAGNDEVHYTGIDLFEARLSDAAGMTLKRAHQHFSTSGARVRLIPGDPFSTLSRMANSLTGTDLLIISDEVDEREHESLSKAWLFVPRMLHDDSVVLFEKRASDNSSFQNLSKHQIDVLARQASELKAA